MHFHVGTNNGKRSAVHRSCCNIVVITLTVWCRGGLIKWADFLGAKVVADKLNGWAKQFEPAGLSGFFKPCKYLQDAADNNTSLEAGRKSSSKM